MAYLQPTFTNGTTTVPYLGSNPFVNGYHMRQGSLTSLVVDAGAARAFSNDFVIAYTGTLQSTPGEMTIDTASVGALGCYPLAASIAAPTDDTSFGVYVLGDTSAENITTAVVATGNNFLLPGYDVWRRVGSVHFESGTNNMKLMEFSGFGTERTYKYNEALEMFSGTGTGGSIDLSAGDLPLNPCFSSTINLHAEFTPVVAANILELNAIPGAATNWAVRFKGSTDAVSFASNASLMPESFGPAATMVYRSTAAGDAITLRMGSYTESLGLEAL